MLPAITQPLVSLASGAGLAAQPLLSGLAAAIVPTATSPRDVLGAAASAVDTLGGTARPGVLPGVPPRSTRARSSGAGYAAAPAARASTGTAASSTKATSTAKKPGPLAFLDDGKLSTEEKLMRLLAYLSDKWEKDIQKKMKEFEAGQQPSSALASSGSQKSGGGLLGSIVKAASGFFPQVGIALTALKNPVVRAMVAKIGPPVLAAAATAAGFPALAPVLLKYAPTVIDAAAGLASSLDSGAGAGAGAASSSGGAAASTPSKTGMNDSEMRLKLMEIERVQNLQKEMFSLVSNILRTGHETRMTIIQNVR